MTRMMLKKTETRMMLKKTETTRSVHGTTSRNEYTGRLLFETGEKSIWFETSPAKLQPKIKTNLCDECWQTNCVIDMCDGAIGADKSYEVFQNRLIFTV